MKKVLIALAGLLVLLVAAILVGPSFIDWNSYKGQIVAAVRDATGRDVAIDGDIAFTVLPAPALRVAGVRVANFDGAQSADMLRLKELRIRVSVAALLERRIVVEQLELIEPSIALEVAEDGRTSWDIAAAAPGGESDADAPSNADAPLDISLANVTIRNGSLTYRNRATGVSEKIDGLDMTISAPSLSGPFTINGGARFRGIPISLDLKTAALKPSQPLNLTLKLAIAEADATVQFSGRVMAPISAGRLSGDLTIEGADAARLVKLFSDTVLPPILARPLSLKGVLTASADSVALNDATFRFGEVSGNGAVSVALGDPVDANIAISIGRLNLDKLLAEAAASTPASTPALSTGGGARGGAAKSPEPAFSLPKTINASLDLGIDVIQYRDGVIRDVGLRAALANGAVTLDRATALLPGGSDISLFGFFQTVDGTPRFEGEVAAASDNLRALLGWIGVDLRDLPADRLRGFSYASKITATPTSVEVPDINIRLDASTMTGGLVVAVRKRLGFGLRIAVDRLNLDAYLPRAASRPAGGSSKPAAKAKPPKTAPAQGVGGALAFLDSFDANVDARIERLTVRKAVARKVRFDGLLVGGALTVRKGRVADFAGARVDVKGVVRDLATTPSFSIDYSVGVNDPERFFRFLGAAVPIAREKLGKPTIAGHIEGDAAALTLKADIAAAGGKFQFDGVVKDAAGALAFDIGVTVNHPELTDFVRLLSPGFRPAAAKLGAVSATFRAEGTPANVKISALDATAGPLTITGDMTLRSGGPRPAVSANLNTSEILLDLFQPAAAPTGAATARGRAAASANGAAGSANGRWSREPIDLSALRAVDADVTIKMAGLISDRIHLVQPEVSAVLKAGRLDLRRFKAKLFGGVVSGSAVVDATGRTPVISADVAASNIDLTTVATTFGGKARVAGPLSANASLTMRGDSIAALIATLAGQGTVNGKVRILITKQEKSAIGALGIASVLFGSKVRELGQLGGVSNVLVQAFGRAPADLTGSYTIARGLVRTNDLTLSGAGARAVTAGVADLPRWRIDSTTSVTRSGDQSKPPVITAKLSGPLDSPNVNVGGSVLGRNAGGTATSNPINQILPGLLGGKTQTQDQQTRKVKPQDFLRSILKGLGK